MTNIVGIHLGHDGGCAISCDGVIAIACAEERLSRKKYANGWWNSLRYCLSATGLGLSDINLIVFSNSGDPLPECYDGGLSSWTEKQLKITNVDHHLSHAFSAFAFSGLKEALVFIGDAGGNSGITESVYFFNNSA